MAVLTIAPGQWLFYAALGMYIPILILCFIAKVRR